MNDKTREQIEAMKNQTIGVEIEMNNITREKAARKVAEYFGTRAWNAASEYGYYSWACKDGQGRVWKFQRDVSIYGPDAEKCELVTPILTYDDIESLQEIIRLLRKAGAKSSPSRGCGVHIHIGKGDHTAKTIRNLVNIMAAHEQQIGRAIRIDAGRTGQYCRVVRPPLPRSAEPREADHHAQAGRHLVRRQRFQLGKPECPLQFKPVPHAEPSCHLYKRNH